VTERNSEASDTVRHVIGGRLLASVNVEDKGLLGPVATSTLGPITVDLYKSTEDGSMVVEVNCPQAALMQQGDSLRVYLNDETIYDSSVSDSAAQTEGE
jgi:hypothetical protein